MKKLIAVMIALVVLASAIAIADAANGDNAKKEKTKDFLSGKSKKEIENIISTFSMVPMLVYAKKYGITEIQGLKLDFDRVPDGTPGPQTFADRPMGTDPAYWENEPSIAAKPASTAYVVAISHKYPYTTVPYVRCVAYRSSDGGETWASPVTLPIMSDNTYCADPVVRWAPDSSRVYASYMSYGGTGPSRILVSSSTNNGATWSAPVVAMTATTGLLDKPWMDVHTFWNTANTSGKVYVSATLYGTGTSIVFTRSTNYAATFESYQTLTTGAVQGSRPIGGKTFSSTLGDVLVCWYNSEVDGFATGVFDIRCRSNTGYGSISSWSPEITAVNNMEYELEYYLNSSSYSGPLYYHRWFGGMFPSIMITYDGTAHIVFAADKSRKWPYADYYGEAGDIYYARAPRGVPGYLPYTTGWSIPRTPLNTDTSFAQGYPTITAKRVSGGSILIAAWEDHRNSWNSPSGTEDCGYGYGIWAPNCYYDIYMATTSPGGADWTSNPNKRVTDISSMSDRASTPGYATMIGDYIDSSTTKILSDAKVQIIWTDRSDISSVTMADDDVWSDRVDIANS